MIFKFDELVAYLSRFVTLKIGDYIFTGTPAGVAKTEVGDKLECYIGEEKLLTVNVR
jgi:2-keto-4-pentenoate hydratase/2-oxohepta-3-ene-1,7-dioic acid hydratase in catechol pathway